MTIFISHIITDNDTDIVKFKPLRGMNTANLIDGIIINCEGACITEVPAHFNSEIITAAVVHLLFLRLRHNKFRMNHLSALHTAYADIKTVTIFPIILQIQNTDFPR